MFRWQQVTPHEHAEVRTALERALEREPNHADAWGCLSWAYVTEHKLGFNTRPDPLDRALGAARRGVELDATSQIVYSALAHAHHCRRELGAFRAAAERVLTLNPRETHCVAFMGLLIATAGDWAKGTSVMREVLALNPHHAGWCHLVFVWDHYRKHEYDKAVEAAEVREAARGDLDAYEAFTRRSVDLVLAADWPWSPWNLARNAFAHVFRGRAEDAKQLFDKAEPERLRGTVWDGTYDGLKLLAFAYLEEPEAMAVFEASRDRLPKLGEENPGGSLLFSDDGHRGVDASRPARPSGDALSAHKGARRKRCDGHRCRRARSCR